MSGKLLKPPRILAVRDSLHMQLFRTLHDKDKQEMMQIIFLYIKSYYIFFSQYTLGVIRGLIPFSRV